MALGDILEAIRRETDEEIERVLTDGRERIGAILAEAAAAAAAREQEVASSRDEETADAARAIHNRAHLEVARRLRTAHEKLYQAALEQVRQQLSEVRASERYPKIFANLANESRAAIPDGRALVVDPRDHELALRYSRETDDTWEIEATLSSWGGMELHTGDGRKALNTLEARLERAGPSLRQTFAEQVPDITGVHG